MAADSLFTLVYLDPPWEDAAAYTQSLNLLAASSAALLAPDAIVIAEHARRGTVTLADTYKSLKRYRLLEQGDAALSFYRQPGRNFSRLNTATDSHGPIETTGQPNTRAGARPPPLTSPTLFLIRSQCRYAVHFAPPSPGVPVNARN